MQSILDTNSRIRRTSGEHADRSRLGAHQEQADGEENYSKEMLQLYFRNSDPNFDLLFDSPGEEAQSAPVT